MKTMKFHGISDRSRKNGDSDNKSAKLPPCRVQNLTYIRKDNSMNAKRKQRTVNGVKAISTRQYPNSSDSVGFYRVVLTSTTTPNMTEHTTYCFDATSHDEAIAYGHRQWEIVAKHRSEWVWDKETQEWETEL